MIRIHAALQFLAMAKARADWKGSHRTGCFASSMRWTRKSRLSSVSPESGANLPESGSWFPPDWGSTLWIQTQASAGTVTPGFQAAQATVGVGGCRRTCCYFRCYFWPGRGLVRPGRGPKDEKTAISRGFLKWCRRRDSNPHTLPGNRF